MTWMTFVNGLWKWFRGGPTTGDLTVYVCYVVQDRLK